MACVAKPSSKDGHLVEGRPDLSDHAFGRTRAKTCPAYVFSVNWNAGLVHKVSYVDLHWYRVDDTGHNLIRLKSPIMIATTICGQSWRLEGDSCRTCVLPDANAILCGRCQRQVASFSKKHNGPYKDLPRPEAHVRLACVIKAY